MIYGYARVSTKAQANDGNSLEAQRKQLQEHGAAQVYFDAFTGTQTKRPEFEKLLAILQENDTLMVTKLDRFARSLSQGSELVNDLITRGITIHILNIGVMDNSPSNTLIRNIFLSFAEFERQMILERTQEGKAIARLKDDYREGRPKKYSSAKIKLALKLLDKNSYSQVEVMTGISKSTLVRAKRQNQA